MKIHLYQHNLAYAAFHFTIIQNGEVIAQQVGAIPHAQMAEFIKQAL